MNEYVKGMEHTTSGLMLVVKIGVISRIFPSRGVVGKVSRSLAIKDAATGVVEGVH